MIMCALGQVLPCDFYLNQPVETIAQKLLGKVLCTHIEGITTKGVIVETEAYSGSNDRASHSYRGKKTERNKSMFMKGGISYVYQCYGIHFMFNIVCNERQADAVLIRAIQPTEGIEEMRQRRGGHIKDQQLTSGPGKLSKSLGIVKIHDRIPLNGSVIWIEDGEPLHLDQIEKDRRVGVDYAGEDALKPWRFYMKNNAFVSIKKQKAIL